MEKKEHMLLIQRYFEKEITKLEKHYLILGVKLQSNQMMNLKLKNRRFILLFFNFYFRNISIFQFIVEFSLSGYFLSSLGSTDCVIFVAEYSDIFSNLRSKTRVGHLGDPPQGGRYYIVTWV